MKSQIFIVVVHPINLERSMHMSHNVLIANVKITSLSALRRAISELQAKGIQISLDNKQTFRTYPGQSTKCNLCISLPGENHDIGLRLQSDGSYLPVYDPFGMSVNGAGISCSIHRGDSYDPQRSRIGQLLQLYSTCVAEDQMLAQGYQAVREYDETTGEMYLTAEV